EPQQPADERQARLDVQRALRIEEPLQRLADHPGRGQGRREARRQPPGVAVGAALADLALVDHGDARARARKLQRAGHADDTRADDQDVRARDRAQFPGALAKLSTSSPAAPPTTLRNGSRNSPALTTTPCINAWSMSERRPSGGRMRAVTRKYRRLDA